MQRPRGPDCDKEEDSDTDFEGGSIAPIWIRSAESGCYAFHHATFKEVEGGLRVTALDRVLVAKPGSLCRLPLYASPYRVELPRPLGGGRIFGECVPGKSTGEQRICARMHEAADA